MVMGLIVAVGSAFADGDQKPQAPKATIKTAPSQTASLGESAHGGDQAPAFSLKLPAVRFDEGTPQNETGALTPIAPAAPPSLLGDPNKPRFVPMLRETDIANDPNSKATSFVDKHEFGIELKSNF
jgi:hypothetical protein